MTIRRITTLSVSTIATEPLRGLVEIRTVHSTTKFELSEDLAHAVCVELEHFLTQRTDKVQGQ
jgi:hypothetical protein